MTASEKKLAEKATIYRLSAKATINWLFPKAVASATAIALQHDNNWDFGCVAADGGVRNSRHFTVHVHFGTEKAWVCWKSTRFTEITSGWALLTSTIEQKTSRTAGRGLNKTIRQQKKFELINMSNK